MYLADRPQIFSLCDLRQSCSNTTNMAAPPSAYKDRHFLAVIGDEVNTTFCFKDFEAALTTLIRTL